MCPKKLSYQRNNKTVFKPVNAYIQYTMHGAHGVKWRYWTKHKKPRRHVVNSERIKMWKSEKNSRDKVIHMLCRLHCISSFDWRHIITVVVL